MYRCRHTLGYSTAHAHTCTYVLIRRFGAGFVADEVIIQHIGRNQTCTQGYCSTHTHTHTHTRLECLLSAGLVGSVVRFLMRASGSKQMSADTYTKGG